jgi:hypothetical protein
MRPWTDAEYEEYQRERAAIMTIDGGVPREQAERLAVQETVRLAQRHTAEYNEREENTRKAATREDMAKWVETTANNHRNANKALDNHHDASK